MAEIDSSKLWIREPTDHSISGPYSPATIGEFAETERISAQHEISFSPEGRWFSPAEFPTIAETFGVIRATRRSVFVLVPHVISLVALGILAFAGSQLSESQIDAAKFAVVICTFVIAVFVYNTADAAIPEVPRWILWIVLVVFLFPTRGPLGRGGWLFLDWLAAFATVLHAKAVNERMDARRLAVRATGALCHLAWFAVLILFFGVWRFW